LLSTLYPGLGSTKISLKGYHIVKGVAAYGALYAFTFYNSKSNQSYNNYLDAELPADRDKYFSDSETQRQTATALLLTAGGVWLFDYITVLATENRSRKKGFKSEIVYLGPAVNPNSGFTGMTMICSF
jgi:hypothetical protein